MWTVHADLWAFVGWKAGEHKHGSVSATLVHYKIFVNYVTEDGTIHLTIITMTIIIVFTFNIVMYGLFCPLDEVN